MSTTATRSDAPGRSEPGTRPAHSCEAARDRRTTGAVGFWRQVTTLAGKDLRVEFRSREILYTMTFFAAMMVVIFSFAFVKEALATDVVPGVVWVALAFSGTLGLSRAFDRERESDTMRGLLLSPASRTAIFLGKASAILVYLLLVQIVVVPLTALLFKVDVLGELAPLVTGLVLGAVGFAVVGTVFAAMLLRSRSRDVLLPVVLYPILIPMLIAGTKSASEAFDGNIGWSWYLISFIGLYDAVFIAAGLWIFESLVIE